MRLSNELVYEGALHCANDVIAHARLHIDIAQKQVEHLTLTIYLYIAYFVCLKVINMCLMRFRFE